MANKVVLNELSLIPNMGIKPSFSSNPGTAVGTTGASSPEIAQKAKALTDQIQLLTAKITASKQQAMKSTQPDQQKIMQYMSQLNQLQSQLAQSEENNEEKIAPKILKAIGRAGGAAIGGATRIPGAASAGAKLGEYNTSKFGKFLGIIDDDEEVTNSKKIQKMQGTALNNIKPSLFMKNKKNTKKVEESLAGTVGNVASGALKTVGTVAGAIPLVGGVLKAGADLAAGGVENVLGNNENEEGNANELTDVQNNAVKALEKRRYRVNRLSYQFAEEEGGPTVYMSKKPNHYTTLYAEVDAEGNVNGDTLDNFLNHAEENEEKVLTKSQQKIAKAAAPFDKITGADFAALKAHKENVDILNFLKSISQKNYAQADKYLGSLVNEKIKKAISRAVDKTK